MSSTQLTEDTVKVEIIPEGLLACRVCLAWDVKLCNIQEWGLADMYVEVAGTTWSSWDGLPQHVCVWCRAALRRAHALIARSRRADALLKQALHHQHFISNTYIRTIDRHTYKLTHALSIKTCKNDVYHYNYDDTHASDPQNNVYVIDDVHNDVDQDLKYLTCHDSVKNDFENDPTSEMDFEEDKLKDSNAKPKALKIVETVDSNVKKVRVKKKRRSTVKNDFQNDPTSEMDFEEDDKLKDSNAKRKTDVKIVEVNSNIKKVRVKKQRQQQKPKATEKRKCSKQPDEDFREFEKKYDFQVQCLTEGEMQKEMDKRRESDKYLKGEYKCDLCYKGFLTLSTYENHMKTHDPARGDNECRLCHLRYQFPVKLRQHVMNAHRLKFRCARCNELVRGKACAVLHAAYHAGATFTCAHCDKRFLKKTSRTSHMRMAHPVENAAGGTCEVCGETFTSRTGLKAHKTRSHKKANLPELRCRKCRIQFDNMEALMRHKETQADNKCDPSLSACEQCGETCASADALILHKHAQHSVELFTCDTCTKSFTSKASLATHIDRIHRRIRPPKADYSDGGRRKQPDWLHWASVCEHCGKRLSCLATLKIHMNKHTGERPYKCSLCPKAYMTPYGLNNHQAFHTGVRKWQCPECPATFMHQSSVYQHRKIHTGERSHQCTICDKYFTQSGSLYTHVKYVHMKETPPPRKRNKKTAL